MRVPSDDRVSHILFFLNTQLFCFLPRHRVDDSPNYNAEVLLITLVIARATVSVREKTKITAT